MDDTDRPTSPGSPRSADGDAPRRVREDEVLGLILRGTASETGQEFFRALVRNVCEALGTAGSWVTEYLPDRRRLRSLAFWFQQLWAESLGKARNLDGELVHTGPTPLAAAGATDQHSLLQLLIEGPQDKVVLFVGLDDRGEDMDIPHRHSEIPSLSYLGGHSLGELLDTERRATAEALRREGRPNATFLLPRIDARAMGELLMLLQVTTVLAGALYGVDPLDQPGVELGKELTYGLMGRDGHPAPRLDEGDPRRVV